MSMYKRYEDAFVTVTGDVVTCQIWQEADGPFPEVAGFEVAGSNPLTIEWHDRAKHEVICGSTATLILNSPGDRTYQDLFTVRPGTIRLDVLRNGILYWSGTLDPELAEEPYTSGMNYYVNLVFSDLGILRRLKYDMTGMQSLQTILSDALTRSGIRYGSIDTDYISTYTRVRMDVEDGIRLTPEYVQVLSENFYDEESKPMSLYDVLEGILRPLGQRMTQRAGKIWIYDLHGLYTGGPTRQIQWGAQDQRLSVDRIYNEVKVTFSPYASATLFPGFEYTGRSSLNDLWDAGGNLRADAAVIYPDYQEGGDETNRSFAITWSHTEADGLAEIHPSAQYFRMFRILGGQDLSGVALWFYTQRQRHSTIVPDSRIGAATCPTASALVLRTAATYLPKLDSDEASKLLIRLRLGILFDVRYNPFEEASRYNEKDEYNYLQNNTLVRLISVPAKVEIRSSANGAVLYHYSNKSFRQSQETGIASPGGIWVAGAASNDDCELFYENPYGESSSGPVSNRQARNVACKSLSAALEAADPGEYIPYPPAAGYLVVTVLAGVKFYSFDDIHYHWHDVRYGVDHSDFDIYTTFDGVRASRFRWILFEAPELDVVKSDLTGSIDNDDVEYSGTINPDAEEPLEIQEICGTMSPVSPAARGLIFDANGEVLTELRRAGRTASPEQLLIGTMLSHHADRKDVLSGTARLGDGSMALLTDAALPGKKLIILSAVEKLREDDVVIRAVETVADDYVTEEESV